MALREDLIQCGFWFLNSNSAPQDFLLEMAIREFQRYARLDTVAYEPVEPTPLAYWARLTPVATGGQKYTGNVTGIADAATLAAVANWITNRWRCPVVMIGFSTGSSGGTVFQENIWLYDELKLGGNVRVYARDLSGVYYPAPTDLNDLKIVGRFQKFGSGGGPISLPGKKLGTATLQITPDLLLGHAITTAETPTYKVIRASAERECAGYFDCINAWDPVFISVGTCHWTLGSLSKKKQLQPGELGAYLAYLQKYKSGGYNLALGRWGVSTEKQWDDAGFPNASQRKYATRLQELQDNPPALANVLSANEANFFRSWHWFYRFEMSARYSTDFQQGMWDMTRIRVRDILTTPFGDGGPIVRTGVNTFRPATLQDVYTAELTVAWLLRWHIKLPAHVVNKKVVGPKVLAAFQAAKIDKKVVNDWPDTAQNCLREKLRAAATVALGDDVARVAAYVVPNLSKLSTDKNSFTLFTTGLPNPPWPVAAADFSADLEFGVAAQATVVINAYVSGQPVYSVLSDGVTFTEQYLNGATKDVRKSVDRLAFYDMSGNFLLAIPVLPGQLSQMKVNKPGDANAEVRLDGSMRCFVTSDQDEYIGFSLRLSQVNGVPTFTTFKWIVNNADLNVTLSNVPLTLGGLQGAPELTTQVPAGRYMPGIGEKFGLKGTKLLPAYSLPWSFQFLLGPPGSAPLGLTAYASRDGPNSPEASR